MQLLRNIPIQRKLTILVMATSCLALFLACGALLVFERVTWRKVLARDLSITARITGENISSALAFLDPDAAAHTLESLSVDPHIVAACVYDKDDRLFSKFIREDARNRFTPPPVSNIAEQFGENRLGVFQKIILGDHSIGTVYVESDLGELHARLIQYAAIIAVVIVVVSLIAFLVSAALQTAISGPIFHLAKVTKKVAAEKNYSLRAVKQSEDELGALIDGFNEMLSQLQIRDGALQKAHNELEKRVQERTLDLLESNQKLKNEIVERRQTENRLAQAHQELVQASRLAGMAEVATGVLHNIGNVLNSVNVSANLVAEQLKNSKVDSIAKICTLIDEHREHFAQFIQNDPRGQKVPEYLQSLARHLAYEQREILRELSSLRKNIDHIKDIVSMQQSYAKVAGVVEKLAVSELIEDAIGLNASALARHEINITRDYEEGLEVTVEKHKVLQILVNLIRNAKFACDEGKAERKEIHVRSRTNGDMMEISVLDNGVGIPAANLTKIFGHGFTTRKTGHGFGLHSGALAAQQMGGSLLAQSEGANCGACFTLQLPRTPKRKPEPDSAEESSIVLATETL